MKQQIQVGRVPKQQVQAGRVLKYAVLIILSVVFLFPLAWMVATSLKTNTEVLSNPTSFFPAIPQWGNYPAVIAALNYWQETLNTLIMALGVTLGQILCLPWPGMHSHACGSSGAMSSFY